jgi:hypothetical protein
MVGATEQLIKDWHRTGNPLLGVVADALNRHAVALNVHSSVPPIVTVAVPGGKKHVWLPWESPFDHPWRVRPSASTPGEIDIMGGHVHDGTDAGADVAALTGVTAANDLRIWLRVKYYNDPATPSEFEIVTGAAWPDNDWSADVLPDASPLTLPDAGWSLTILRIAEIDSAGTLHQYLYEDVVLPRGGTYTTTTCIGFRLSGSTIQAIMVTQTTVNGVPQPVASAPVAVDIADLGPCPTGST